jgi:hypothetical protein
MRLRRETGFKQPPVIKCDNLKPGLTLPNNFRTLAYQELTLSHTSWVYSNVGTIKMWRTARVRSGKREVAFRNGRKADPVDSGEC